MAYLSFANADWKMLFAVFVIPAFGVITLIMLARALGFTTTAKFIAPADATREARNALLGFHPVETALSLDGGAALVRAEDGRIALVRPHGDRWVVRVVHHAKVRRIGTALDVQLAEAMFPPVRIELGAAASRWAAQLEKAA